MSELLDQMKRAREADDFAPVLAAIPYANFLGLHMAVEGDRLRGKLKYGDHLIGNAFIQALHGGTIGALLESTAIFEVIRCAEIDQLPKIISLTVEYLRPGKAEDTYAEAELTRLGGRVANVRVKAWQSDPDKPIAAANALILISRPKPESA